jgi:hypothetical protein
MMSDLFAGIGLEEAVVHQKGEKPRVAGWVDVESADLMSVFELKAKCGRTE